MSIVTHPSIPDEDICKEIFARACEKAEFKKVIDSLFAPMNRNRSAICFSSVLENIKDEAFILARKTVVSFLEQMDAEFRYSTARVNNYYVKQTRPRTIVTMIGEITYRRTEYIDKHTGASFIYVDREIGLLPRMRYDNSVAAEAYEQYSNHNSMIKVGENLSKEIYGFSMKDDRHTKYISRQQIFNMINRFKQITASVSRLSDTPDTIYIMADEKYINLQQMRKVWMEEQLSLGFPQAEVMEELKKQHFDEMVKMGVIFTGREEILNKQGDHLERRRWKLTGKWHISFPNDPSNFWIHTYDILQKLFDMDKVKNIYILGDGAKWIRAGTNELRSAQTKCRFALDRYHLSQAIHRITKEKDERELLLNYAKHGMTKEFKYLCEMIISEGRISEDTIRKQMDYVLHNITAIKVMKEEVKIGCAMEQAIQHVLASPFSSVPKAYGRDHLRTYVNARINQQNGLNMIKLYLTAVDKYIQSSGTCTDSIDLSEEDMNWSFFDDQKPLPYHHVNLPGFDTRAI